jgi:hypothetical protein
MRDVDGRRGCFWTDGNRCTVQGRKLRRSTTGGVHVGSAAFGDKWRVKQVRRRRFGLASSSVHVRRGRPPPHGSRRYRPLPGRARFHVDDGSVQTRAASPLPSSGARSQGRVGCRRTGKCARSENRFWLDVRLRHKGQAQCGDGNCTEDSPQQCPRITEPAAATQRVGRQCRGGVWLVRGLTP